MRSPSSKAIRSWNSITIEIQFITITITIHHHHHRNTMYNPQCCQCSDLEVPDVDVAASEATEDAADAAHHKLHHPHHYVGLAGKGGELQK